MAKRVKTISKTNLLVSTAVAAFIGPRLAADKKLDVVPYFKGLTAKTYKKDIKAMVTKLVTDALPLMTPEAKPGMEGGKGPDDVIHMLASHIIGGAEPGAEAMKTDEIPMGPPVGAPGEGEEPGADGGNEGVLKFLADCGMDEATIAKVKEMLGGGGEAAPPEGADGNAANGPTNGSGGGDEEEEDDEPMPIDKKTMDAALKKTAADTEKRIREAMTAAAEAREFVRPYVGAVAMAHDSAVKVYQAAAGTLKIDGAEKVTDPHALRMLIQTKPRLDAAPVARANDALPALEADVEDSLRKRYPGAAAITLGG